MNKQKKPGKKKFTLNKIDKTQLNLPVAKYRILLDDDIYENIGFKYRRPSSYIHYTSKYSFYILSKLSF